MWIVSAYSQFLWGPRCFLHDVVIFSIEQRVHISMLTKMCQRPSLRLENSQLNSRSGLERDVNQLLTEICTHHLVLSEEVAREWPHCFYIRRCVVFDRDKAAL